MDQRRQCPGRKQILCQLCCLPATELPCLNLFLCYGWAGHASISTTRQYYLQVSDGDYSKAASENFWLVSENVSENGKNEENQSQEQNKKAL
jgi:hypothetical protein